MSRRFRLVLLGAALLALVGVAGAQAITGSFPPTKISVTASLLPRELPRTGGAPIVLSNITRVSTTDGSAPSILERISFLIDKNGSVDANGVPVCTEARLEGTTTTEARKRCAGSLVGDGIVKAQVNQPGKPRTQTSSAISFFNGPKVGGRPSLIAHFYETVPTKKTQLVPITVDKVNNGRYGFGLDLEFPPIAEGFGSVTLLEAKIGRTFKRGGRQVGYLNAVCSGGRLQVQGLIFFTNGDRFPATLTSPCHLPR